MAFAGRGFLGVSGGSDEAGEGLAGRGRADDTAGRGGRVVGAERPFRPLAAYGGTYRRRIDLKLGVAAVTAGRKPVLQFAGAPVVCASEILDARQLIARTHGTVVGPGTSTSTDVRTFAAAPARRSSPFTRPLSLSPAVCPGSTGATGRGRPCFKSRDITEGVVRSSLSSTSRTCVRASGTERGAAPRVRQERRAASRRGAAA